MGIVSPEELLFFDSMPAMLPVYDVLREKLLSAYPDVGIRVTKTQISFKNRYIFAVVSFQRVQGCPKDHLLVTFGLGYPKQHPRIAVVTEASPNRWTHHVPVTRPEQLDSELMGWIDEAYQFALIKGRGKARP